MKARGIPYALRGGPGLWDRREVDDLVVLLRFVADPGDRLSPLAAVLRGPLVGLTDAGLAHLFARAGGMDDLLDPPHASLRAALCVEDRTRLDEARPRHPVGWCASAPPSVPCRVLRQVLAAEEGLRGGARGPLPFGAAAGGQRRQARRASPRRRRSAGPRSPDLRGFVQYVDRMREAAQRESEADLEEAATGSVSVMSIHAARREPEWPVVFVGARPRVARSRGSTACCSTRGGGGWWCSPAASTPSTTFALCCRGPRRRR